MCTSREVVLSFIVFVFIIKCMYCIYRFYLLFLFSLTHYCSYVLAFVSRVYYLSKKMSGTVSIQANFKEMRVCNYMYNVHVHVKSCIQCTCTLYKINVQYMYLKFLNPHVLVPPYCTCTAFTVHVSPNYTYLTCTVHVHVLYTRLFTCTVIP